LDLREQVGDALLLARSSGEAAFVLVRGEFPDMAQQIA
jgi:hypothetical protein